jgi:putative heme-binding domain-containing protein
LRGWNVLVLVVGLALPVYAQHGVVTNRFTSPEDVAAGGRIFRSHCANCHGIDGTGEKGPDLTRGVYRHGSEDLDLYKTISEGVPGSEMAGIFFEGKQMWQIVAYVRALADSSKGAPPTGDATRGGALVSGKGGCLQCHMAGGEGGRIGPSLDDIGAARSPSHLRTAILEPGEEVLPRHWTIKATTKKGEAISGRRLNEDTYSIQLLDSNDRLLSLDKSDLDSYEIVKKSAMPSYKDMLTDSEVDDIVAYLVSLRRRGTVR